MQLAKNFTKDEIVQILESQNPQEYEFVFENARKIRSEIQGNKIFAYGFVYFSTFCRNDCNFCYFRKSNNVERYRKNRNEVLELAESLIESGVNLIDLTTGEDPLYHQEQFDEFCDIIKYIKNDLNTSVMVSPGVVPDTVIKKMKDAGADWYALYQETHNRKLFAKLRINQSYDERMNAKLFARNQGMLIEEGLLTGVGETAEDIADSILTMGEIGAKQVRVMSFVPQEGSPMENNKTPDRIMELKIIAIMRNMFPEALIPASLDVDGISGLRDRINAGANLITSIIPPRSGLMGVAHSVMDVDNGGRTIAEAKAILSDMDLRIATKEEYEKHMKMFTRGTC